MTPADKPDAKEEPGFVHGRGDGRGGEKDARADDAADQQHHRVHECEAANQ